MTYLIISRMHRYEQTIASGEYGNMGAERIKPVELHVCAPEEDDH